MHIIFGAAVACMHVELGQLYRDMYVDRSRTPLPPAARAALITTQKWRCHQSRADVRVAIQNFQYVLCGIHKLLVPQTKEVHMWTGQTRKWVNWRSWTICRSLVNLYIVTKFKYSIVDVVHLFITGNLRTGSVWMFEANLVR